MVKLIDLEKGWAVLKKGILRVIAILEGQSKRPLTPDEFMRNYTMVYDMATQKSEQSCTPALYERQRETLVEYINLTVLPSLRKKHHIFLLRDFVRRWLNHKILVRYLAHFFAYLDQYFTVRNRLPSIRDADITCFHDLVYNEMKDRVKDVVLYLIDQEREGEKIDRALIKNVLDIFIEVGNGTITLYENDFEAPMLEKTAAGYFQKASYHILVDSFQDYMLMAEDCLKREKDRASHYLHLSSEPKLLKKTQHVLLFVYANQLLEKEQSGLDVLLQDGKDLSRLYRFFSKITGDLDPVSALFKKYVIAAGMALVNEAEDAVSHIMAENKDPVGLLEQVFITKVIELHDKYMAYITDCFMYHAQFPQALRVAFEVFCNKDIAGCSCSKILAAFCDSLLKKGGRGEKLSDEEIEGRFEKIVKILAYIYDKDIFAKFYWKKLAHRLLFDRSGNEDLERRILTKFKQECSAQFTSKMEGMVTDMTLSRENQLVFQSYLKDNQDQYPIMDMSVTVLTPGLWPSDKSSYLNLPSEMVSCIDAYTMFYLKNTKKRKLSWVFSMGTCHVIAKFDPRPIELVVSTYQAAVLLLFNYSERLSHSEIMLQLKLTDDDITRLLHSLSCAKYNILIKEPNTKTISSSDNFEINSKFTNKQRIQVPLPLAGEKKKVVEDVEKDRRYMIDALIVRIMKMQKVLGHQQLVMECVEQLSSTFKPDAKMIKRRIEDLISRDYLERDTDNHEKYKYVA